MTNMPYHELRWGPQRARFLMGPRPPDLPLNRPWNELAIYCTTLPEIRQRLKARSHIRCAARSCLLLLLQICWNAYLSGTG